MTRLELIKILVGQAHANGFEFRRWFTTRLNYPWEGGDQAFRLLDSHRRYYALLFSHDFAQAFWKSGEPITFQVPVQTFQRRMADGSIGTVERRSFTRRARPDAWRYHLRQMALAEEPLRYMRKYLQVHEEPIAAAPPPKLPAQAAPRPLPPTLLLARQAHERRQNALAASTKPPPVKRAPRLPGSKPKSR
jgi:hypothetical protein